MKGALLAVAVAAVAACTTPQERAERAAASAVATYGSFCETIMAAPRESTEWRQCVANMYAQIEGTADARSRGAAIAGGAALLATPSPAPAAPPPAVTCRRMAWGLVCQ